MQKAHRKRAKELLHMSSKVFHYRRDEMSAAQIAELGTLTDSLSERLKSGSDEGVKSILEQLDQLLRNCGGKMYPKTFWNDNVEVLLVAAIVVIGIRTFFFQPFIIPTNSMYPTYSGMNAVVYENDEAPGAGARLFNLATQGARHYSLKAETQGEISIPFGRRGNGRAPYYDVVSGRKWFGLLPAQFKEYVIFVGDRPHRIRVPAEFHLEQVLQDSLLQNGQRQLVARGDLQVLPTGIEVEPGDTILRFDITLGDALFVDRLSYHFIRPKPGDPFVFRTRNIPGIEGDRNTVVDKYYIKRIGGGPGEALTITEDGTLLVDGEPRDEAAAFIRNQEKEGEYGGYEYPSRDSSRRPPLLLTGPDDTISVPEGKYVALGDNSDDSLDSRYWGYVPERSIVGRAIFIYYPFTKRWGLAE